MKNNKVIIKNDEPTDIDVLGFKTLAESLAEILVSENLEAPLTIGIFGSWGSGKTSFMKMLYKSLKEKDNNKNVPIKLHLVWFDAWKFENVPQPWTAILLNILNILEEYIENNQTMKNKLLNRIKSFFREMEILEFIKMGIRKFLHQEKIEVDININNKWKDATIKINDFERHFDELITEIIDSSKEKGRLIIFIDDLDRCSHNKIIDVLSGVNLFLSSSKCIYIFAMDRMAIKGAIQTHISNQLKGDKDSDFFDKLVQVEVNVPNPPISKIEEYMKFLGSESLITYLEDIINVCGTNPRMLKRISNTFQFYRYALSQFKTTNRVLEQDLVVLLLLSFRKWELYNWIKFKIETDANQLKILKDIVEDGRETAEKDYRSAGFDDETWHRIKSDPIVARLLKSSSLLSLESANIDNIKLILNIIPSEPRVLSSSVPRPRKVVHDDERVASVITEELYDAIRFGSRHELEEACSIIGNKGSLHEKMRAFKLFEQRYINNPRDFVPLDIKYFKTLLQIPNG